jgi:hypothetical protein
LIAGLAAALLALAGSGAGADLQDLDQALSMAPGESRARILTELLPRVPASRLQDCLVAGFEDFMGQSRVFRLDLSRPLAEAMHGRAAATWSAMTLALICTRDGLAARAQEVLLEQLERTPEGVEHYELLERLGLARLGAGDETGSLAPLGAAFARGSANAGVVLGRLELHAGHLGRARSLFRSLLDEDPPQSWALRGWGLSMVPSRNRRALHP